MILFKVKGLSAIYVLNIINLINQYWYSVYFSLKSARSLKASYQLASLVYIIIYIINLYRLIITLDEQNKEHFDEVTLL